MAGAAAARRGRGASRVAVEELSIILMLDYSNVRSKQVYSDLTLITRRGRHSAAFTAFGHSRWLLLGRALIRQRQPIQSVMQVRVRRKLEAEPQRLLHLGGANAGIFLNPCSEFDAGCFDAESESIRGLLPRVRGKRANILSLRLRDGTTALGVRSGGEGKDPQRNRLSRQ